MAAAAAHLRLDMGEMAGIMPRMTEVFSEMGYTGASGAAAMLSWASALRGVTKNSGEAGNAAARMLEQASGPGMAAALKMPQSELHRIIEMAKSEGTDVMSVITGMIQHRADTTGKSVNEILDKMTARERRLWRAATEGRNEVKKANEELANHSDGMSKRFADNFRKGPQQAINELAQSYEALKRKLGESLDKIGVTSGLKSTTTDLNRILELIELIERHGTYAKALMTDIVQGKWTTTSPELDKAKKDLDEAKKRIFDGYSARRSGEGSDVSDQERLEDAFGKSGGGKRAPAPSGMPGWTGRPLPMVPNLGGAQHFAGGGGFGGGGSIAGRNWQHDLLGGGAMSGNIEDRRNTEATRSNTEALKRLEDIIDDANVTKGGLADQLGIGSIGGGRGAGGRFGGTSGGRVGGGVGGGGGGGVAGAGSGGPGTGMGDSTAGGSGMDGLPRGPAAGQAVYDKMLTAFQGSDVVGKIPPGGERFGFKTGSAEEWAKFGTGVAKAESSFNPATSNLSDPGGSHGILQYAHGQVPGGNAHNVDASIAAFVRDAGKGGVTRGSLLGRRFSTIGSHPERTIKNMRDYTGSAGAAAGTNAGGAPPGGGGLVSHQGSGAMVPAELKMQMEYASAMAGVNTNIAHGMEPGHARHRPGAPAGDIDLLDPATGKKLDSSIPADRAKMSAYITAAAASGAKGIGMGGPGQYMGASRMHVGGGTPAVWGHGGSGANTPGWVREAYNKGIQNPVSSAQQQAAIGAAKGGTAVGFTNAVSKGTPVQVTSVTSDASKALTEAHSSAIDKATEKAATAAGGGADAGDDAGSAKDRANAVSRAQKAAGVDPSSASSPYGAKGFGKSGFGADHRTGKLDSELDTASGKGRQRGFGRSNFGGRHQEGELDSASGKRLGGGGSRGAGGKFDEELDSASGKKGRGHQSENATGSPAGLPKQASFNLDKTQFSRRDRAMDKAAQTALHQASENSHSDIGVA
jgi:hypothetical protein